LSGENGDVEIADMDIFLSNEEAMELQKVEKEQL